MLHSNGRLEINSALNDTGAALTADAGSDLGTIALLGGASEMTEATSVTLGGHGETLDLGSGDRNVGVSGYANHITGQDGDSVVQVGGLGNNVDLGDGNDSVTTVPGSAYADVTLGEGSNQVNLGGTLNTVSLGNGANTVAMTSSNNNVTAGNGPDRVSGGTGNSSVTLGDGIDSVALGGWGNHVTVGDGDDSLDGGVGGATIDLGEGNDTVTLHGRSNTVIGRDGNDSVTGGGQSDTVRLGGGNDTVALGGLANVIVLGDGTNTVSAGSGSDSVQVGGGANSITLAGTHNTVVAGNGNDTVTGSGVSLSSITLGDGVDMVQAEGDYDSVAVGNGLDNVTLGGVGNTLTGGNGGVTVNGGTGHSTVTLGTGDNHVMLGGWANMVTIGGGTSTVDAGAGASTIAVDDGIAALTLHGRADVVLLHDAAQASITDLSAGLQLEIDSGNVVAAITGFGASSGAVLDVTDAGFTGVTQVLTGLHTDGRGGTMLALGGTGSVDFLNLAPSALSAASFIVGEAATSLDAEAPTLSVKSASGNQGSAIGLKINAAQAETSLASANLSVTVSGLQDASLNHGTRNANGSYTLDLPELTGLSLIPTTGFAGHLALTITATDSEPASNTTASSSQTLGVAVYPLAEAPELAVQAANGAAGAAIALTISASQAAPDLPLSDLSLTISGLQGATLNQGTLNADGSYLLLAGDLAGLTITPPAGFAGVLALSIAATDTEAASGTSASTGAQILDVTVQPAVVPPLTPVFNLATADQIASATQPETDSAYVTLVGQTTPGDTVTLVATGAGTIADTSGAFEFDNVALTPGTNTLTVQASDSVGNISTASLGVVRDAAIVTAVTAPLTMTQFVFAPVDYTLDLSGLADVSGQVEVQAYLNADGTLDAGALPAASATLSLSDLSGASPYAGEIDLAPSSFGSLPFGSYQVIVAATLSVDGTTLLSTSSATSASVLYEPAYVAQVTTPALNVVAGGDAQLSGIATSTTDGSAVPYAPVDVVITHGAFQETLTTTTDGQGNFTVDFQSLAGAEGLDQVSAYNPDLLDTGAMPDTTVDVVGFDVAQPQISVTAATGIPVTGTITLDNPSDQALTGITATTAGLPADWSFALSDLPTTLAANSVTSVAYTLTAPTQSDAASFTTTIAAADGASATETFTVASHPTQPDLVVDASSLTTSIVTGGQTLLTLTIQNDGQLAASDVRLSLPSSLSWLSEAGPQNLGSIAGGGSLTVSLLADPGTSVPLGDYTGTIAVEYGADSGQDPTTSVPFDFTLTTNQTGSVDITLSDEATYLTAGAPHVQGATVTITDATGATVGTYADVNNSLAIQNLTVGSYSLQITAVNHLTYNQTIQVTAGAVDNVDAFLPMQVATYDWSVVKSTVTDMYEVSLTSQFETDVPVPIVTTDPPILDFSDLNYGQSKIIDVTITNHGFISVENVVLNLPSPTGYSIEPLVGTVPQISAMGSIQVPVTITRLPQLINVNTLVVDASTLALDDDTGTQKPTSNSGVLIDQRNGEADPDASKGSASTDGLDALGTAIATSDAAQAAAPSSISFPSGANPTVCDVYGTTSGFLAFSYLCGPELISRSVPIGLQGDYIAAPPCLPGPPGVWVEQPNPGNGGRGIDSPGEGNLRGSESGGYFSSGPVQILQSIVCASLAEGVFVGSVANTILSSLGATQTYLDSGKGEAIRQGFGVIFSILKGSVEGAEFVRKLAEDTSAYTTSVVSALEASFSSQFSILESDVSQAASYAGGGPDFSTIFGTTEESYLLTESDPSKFLQQLVNLLEKANENSETTPPGVDYTNLAAVKAALVPILGAQFGGVLDLLDYSNQALAQFNYRAYLVGDLRWFDTTDIAGLENFLSFVANAYTAGVPITDSTTVPVPAGVDPSLLSEFVDRFNLTLTYWGEGIVNLADVPIGGSSDFVALDVLSGLFERFAGPVDESDSAAAQILAGNEALTDAVLGAKVQLEIAED